MNEPDSILSVGQSSAEPRARTRAKAKIAVQSYNANPYDQTASPALVEVRLTETFAGISKGNHRSGLYRFYATISQPHLVSMQRFSGKLDGRQGTFVLQGSEIVENGRIKARWFVVPGSGTDDLSRLRGDGGFEGVFGKGSDGTLDYWFE
jgi:hypothetical protein